ncbi:MAG: DNA polymerase IV [Clostridia bacterium]|nr:DNA polymerase IV [Clostridia bacterium]
MRTILHSDLNNFYASVECLLNPDLNGKPVAVCGKKEDRHGIVLAKNMIAKKAGVKTGMALFEAERLCPGIVCVPARHDMYLKYSRAVRKIYLDYTDQVEPFGIDEAWLDVTTSPKHNGNGFLIAEEIRKRVKEEIGLTVSIGVSFNKVFAKLGSDIKKPDAVTIIDKDNFKQMVWRLPASELLYVGRATKEKLEKLTIKTIGELATFSKKILVSKLGKWGEVLQAYARGQDQDPVRAYEDREEIKSVGNSITYYRDITTDDDVYALLTLLSESVCSRMKNDGFKFARTVALTITTNDLHSVMRTKKLERPTNLSCEITSEAFALFKKNFAWGGLLIRGLGVAVSDFTDQEQLDFCSDNTKREKLAKLEETIETMRDRFGRTIINKGIMLTDSHLSEMNIKGDLGALSKEKTGGEVDSWQN